MQTVRQATTTTGLAALAALLLLAACGGGAGEPPMEAAPEPAAALDAAPAPVREITNITGNLYRARNDNHFTVFLVTDEGVILADPINADFAAWLRDELATRFDAEVRSVLYSHHHWDHASGGALFADTATFVGHSAMPGILGGLPENAAVLDTDGDGALSRAEATGAFAANFDMFDRDGDGQLGADINGEIHPPDTLFDDRTTVELGGSTVEMIHPGVVHSSDATVILFPEERALYVVDFINARRLPGGMAPYTFEQYAAAIAVIETLDFDTLLPGHGDVGTKASVTEFGQFLADVRTAVQAGIDAGQSLEDVQASVTLDQYADWLLFADRRPTIVADAYRLLTAQP
jgi:glyoxylase-like metal-dependent hydrolase (beta-lactamase superfamily II)